MVPWKREETQRVRVCGLTDTDIKGAAEQGLPQLPSAPWGLGFPVRTGAFFVGTATSNALATLADTPHSLNPRGQRQTHVRGASPDPTCRPGPSLARLGSALGAWAGGEHLGKAQAQGILQVSHRLRLLENCLENCLEKGKKRILVCCSRGIPQGKLRRKARAVRYGVRCSVVPAPPCYIPPLNTHHGRDHDW